jgi:tetratricopeptide (TPR) repeat protein
MAHWRLALVLVALLLVPAAAQPGPAPPQPSGQPEQSERVRKGVGHFDRAFYELTPQKRDRDAAREFDLAVAEFQGELAARPTSTVAHRYLARIYTARGDFGNAAEHYDRLMALEPLDVDVCVLAALAHAEDGRFAEARARLAAARLRTEDPAVLARLADYAAKLNGRTP